MFIDLDGLEEAKPNVNRNTTVIKIPRAESTCQNCGTNARAAEEAVNTERAKKLGFSVGPRQKQASISQYKSNEQRLFEANYDTYGQYLPGPSDIVDGLTALQELGKGNYKGAAAAAFFLIPGADVFKPVRALKGVGGELLEGYLKKFGNQADHLTKLDIEGAIKDIAGTPVVKHGKVWNHLKEVEDALSGVGNQLEKLTKDINGGKFSDEVLKQAETIRGTLQKQKDKLSDVLNEAKKNAKQ
jgi:hypothetical protein